MRHVRVIPGIFNNSNAAKTRSLLDLSHSKSNALARRQGDFYRVRRRIAAHQALKSCARGGRRTSAGCPPSAQSSMFCQILHRPF
jgi:hypothetical protein